MEPAAAREGKDPPPRTAIVCAFAPELPLLAALVEGAERRLINGLPFITGDVAGRPVVLLLCGMGMVNAAMATQLVLERFTVERIVVAGIAGGLDPALEVGAVVIPSRWAQPLEATSARVMSDGYGPDILADGHGLANFGMIFPHAADMRTQAGAVERRLWFDADPELLRLARALDMADVHVGGAGVSGPVFVDNAAYAGYLFDAFGAQAVDMETAAIAQVAHANGVPFIGIRGLSDRAGAEVGPNTALVHAELAAKRCAEAVKALLILTPPP